MKMKTDQKTKKRKRLFQCPFRITLICSYYKQFYACLIQIIDDYITRMERYGYGEEYIDKLIDYTILKYTWKYRNQTVGKCKCKAISFIDDEITSRKPRNGIAVTEPCLKFRCSQLIKDGKCEWLQLCSEYKVKPKQLKLVGFVNGDDTKWSVNHIQDIS
jgi:Zn-finger domain-containing protein